MTSIKALPGVGHANHGDARRPGLLEPGEHLLPGVVVGPARTSVVTSIRHVLDPDEIARLVEGER